MIITEEVYMNQLVEKKETTVKQSVAVLSLIMVTLLIGFLVLQVDGIVMLALASVIAGLYAKYLGYSWNEMTVSIAGKISEAIPAMLILLSIGALTGSWMAAGVIPSMIYYSLILINPHYLLLTAFIGGAIISLATGTSWGTVATIGVAMIGVAIGMEIPLPMIAGAVISGAYFGDKMSPLSDTTNMAALAAKADLHDHIKQMTVTTVPAMIIACVIFTALGYGLDGDLENSSVYINMLTELDVNFVFSPLMFLPPLVILIGSVTRQPTVPVIVLSSLISVAIAHFVQGFDLPLAISTLKSGFSSSASFEGVTISKEVGNLLNRGGIESMFSATIFIIAAFTFGGLIQQTKIIEVSLRGVLSMISSTRSLVLSSGLSASVIVAITQNSYISYFLVSETYGDKYKELGLKPQNLSRILEDFVTVIEGLLPWTVSGVYMATTLGVPVLDFAPYAIFNLACIGLSIVYALTYKSVGKFAFARVSTADSDDQQNRQAIS